MTEDHARSRAQMVKRDIAARGIEHPGVLRAMSSVPRERFVSPDQAALAYKDHPLPIAAGQTISQPYIVALMAQAAEVGPNDRVLEVGAGSGYGAAVLSRVVAEVWTVERHEELANRARQVLEDLGYDNVHVIEGDGTLGYPEAGPFDAIVVTAGGPTVPDALLEQLADGGRMVIPIGPESPGQELTRIRRHGTTFESEALGSVRFVPLVDPTAGKPPPISPTSS